MLLKYKNVRLYDGYCSVCQMYVKAIQLFMLSTRYREAQDEQTTILNLKNKKDRGEFTACLTGI